MSTTYDTRQLTLADKLWSCSHVITGMIQGVESSQVEELPTGLRIITVFTIKVVKVEFGTPLPRRIAVRVVGGKSEGVTTPWTAKMDTDKRMLFVLAPDHGTQPNQFVPCFGAVYPLTSAGHLELERAAVAELRAMVRLSVRANITAAAVGAAARSVRRTVVMPKANVQSVELDRMTVSPTEIPVRQIKTAPRAVRKRSRRVFQTRGLHRRR